VIKSELQDRFQQLIEEHKKIIYKVCSVYCRNRDDWDDLAQEIVLQLWRSFSTFDDRRRFSTWMYRVALNIAISFYRREKTRARHVIPAGECLLESAGVTDDRPEELELLYQMIEGLDPLNKAMILLYLDGNRYHEIGEVLGISETNVATKLNRLKLKLKREITATKSA
jgi:RNA polymerase sigma-70 factor (ECF subfamily)